jgi:hypothetical protein
MHIQDVASGELIELDALTGIGEPFACGNGDMQ